MRVPILVGWMTLAAFGQPKFEVASVKPAAPVTEPGTQISVSGDRLSYRNTTLKNALARAYGVKFPGQVVGPSWLTSERYDIVAKAPAGTSVDQMLLMLRALLDERFALKLRHEARGFPGYALVAGKGKPGFQEAADDETEGFEVVSDRRQAKGMSMASLVRQLALLLQAPVLDETALVGRYTFPFEYAMEETGKTEAPSIMTIISELGLKLEPRKVPLDVIVVDNGRKVPSAN